MPAISFLNGTWQAPEDAKISVLDRGFMFGDGVYEVIPVYNKHPFGLARHLKRLDNSLAEVDIPSPRTDAEWAELIDEAIERSEETIASVYIQVTRGIAPKRDHRFPETPVPTVLVIVSPAPLLERKAITPLNIITMDDFRWARGHIKTISLIAAGMLRNEAIARGADDAILVKDGRVTEATASNIFIAKDGVLITPPKSNHLLHGITRDVVVEVARDSGITVEEREVALAELETADEIMISSSIHEIWPVGTLDGRTIGNGEGGVMWQQLDKLFQAAKLAD